MSLSWQEDWDGNCLLLSAGTNSTKLTSSFCITANYSADPLSLELYASSCLSFALSLALSFAVGEISSVEQRDARELVQPIQERQAGKTHIHSRPEHLCRFTSRVCILCVLIWLYNDPSPWIPSYSLLLLKRIWCSYASAAYIKSPVEVVSLYFWPNPFLPRRIYLLVLLRLLIFCAISVFLRGQRWEPGWCRPNDLFETAECHSQARLHLHLPEFSRLVWQCVCLLPARSPLQGQQRRRADTSQKPLHQRRAWRMPGQCSSVPGGD